MGTSSIAAKSVWAPRVSGLLGARFSFASTGSYAAFHLFPCRPASGSRSFASAGEKFTSSWQYGTGQFAYSSCEVDVVVSRVGKKVASSVEKRAMRTKRGARAGRVDGMGALPRDDDSKVVVNGKQQPQGKCGSIHLILGPMFAGKSTALLKRAEEESKAGRRVALVKSDKDSRYSLSAIVTHDGVQMPCYSVPDFASFRSQVGPKMYREFDVIGIDEAQFFSDLYEFCLNAADFEGKTIIAAGLDGDFLRRRFGSTTDLVKVADSVVKLSSRCEICGRPAIFTYRKTLDIQTEVIGGSDIYMPVCRQHYVSGEVVVDSPRTVLEAAQLAHSIKEV